MPIRSRTNARAASSHLNLSTLPVQSAAVMCSVSSVVLTVPANSISSLMVSATQLNSDVNNTDTVSVSTALEGSLSRKESVLWMVAQARPKSDARFAKQDIL